MNYRSNKQNRLVIALFLLAGLLIFLFFYFNFSKPIGGFFSRLARPIFQAKQGEVSLESRKSLIAENTRLKNLLESYRLELIYSDLIAEENKKLREILDYRKGKETLLLAPVLATPPRSLYDTLVIDVGSEDGLLVGEKVIISPNILLGEVAEVSRKTSKVRLYSTSGERLSVRLLSGMPVEIIGRGGGNFKMELPRDVEVALEEKVILPPEYLIAAVYKIDSDPREPIQTVYLRSPINIYTLSFVEIVKE